MWGPVSSTKFLAASSRLRTELRDRPGSASRLRPARNHGVGCVGGKHRGVLALPGGSPPLPRRAGCGAMATGRWFSASMSPPRIISPTRNVCRYVQMQWEFLGFARAGEPSFSFPMCGHRIYPSRSLRGDSKARGCSVEPTGALDASCNPSWTSEKWGLGCSGRHGLGARESPETSRTALC